MKKLIVLFVMAIALIGLVNAAPILNSVSSQSINEGSTLSFILTTSIGPDNGSTSFTMNESHGTLTKINNTKANFTWTPGFTESGVYSFTFNASDANSSSLQVATITVNDIANSAAIIITSTTIGSDKQNREKNASTTFIITNNGTDTLTSMSVSDNALAKYKITYSNTPTTLTAGNSITVTITGYVPDDFDAVDNDLEEKAFSIGTITVSGKDANSNTITNTGSLSMQAVNQLEIDKVKVTIGDETDNTDDGDTVKNIKPGDDITVEITLENRFDGDDEEDIDFEDVEITIEIDDNDFDVDEDDELDVDADEKESISFDFSADDEADGTVSMIIRIDGRDDNGARHGMEWTVKLKVERESHEVLIRRLTLNPSTVSCIGTLSTVMKVNLINIGKKNEDDMTVQILNSDLKLDQIKDIDELDKDDSTTKTFSINIPSTTKDGSYPIVITSYYESGSESDVDQITLIVTGCDADETVTEFVDTESDDSSATAIATTSSSGRAAKIGSGFSGNTSTTVLIVSIIVALGIIGVLWKQMLLLKK